VQMSPQITAAAEGHTGRPKRGAEPIPCVAEAAAAPDTDADGHALGC